MPVMEGRTFLVACRRQPRCARVPVILVSGESTACEDAKRLGAQACILKPFDVDRLAEGVDRLFTGKDSPSYVNDGLQLRELNRRAESSRELHMGSST